MQSRTVNGRSYTRRYAWLPVRTRAGELVWLAHYYIRPDRAGQGVVLSQFDFQLEMVKTPG
jgi:hypothetical protein